MIEGKAFALGTICSAIPLKILSVVWTRMPHESLVVVIVPLLVGLSSAVLSTGKPVERDPGPAPLVP